ncbi:hypothetical protein GJ496_004925 [Pomphorhynchus laevis]|nr:hypothetical protein GJ496_004925 [Pomphorhynchus laevis]
MPPYGRLRHPIWAGISKQSKHYKENPDEKSRGIYNEELLPLSKENSQHSCTLMPEQRIQWSADSVT